MPDFVESGMCSTTKCTFNPGSTFTARAGLTAKGNFTNLSASVRVKKLFFWFDVDLPASVADVCKSLEAEAKCPIKAGYLLYN